ncbi:MAG: sigma-70 family RNA polymerase sigma factor [Bacteroidota bacterium]
MKVDSQEEKERDILQVYQRRGSQRLLGALYNQYIDLVYGVCLKYLKDRVASQDAVMDIYEEISEKLRANQIENFKNWLYVVTKNHCLMKLRKEKRESAHQIIMESSTFIHHEEDTQLEADLVALEICIENLKKEQQVCVKQFFLEKKSYQEIEAATNIDIKKVKSHIQNGKRNLKICLERKNVKY